MKTALFFSLIAFTALSAEEVVSEDIMIEHITSSDLEESAVSIIAEENNDTSLFHEVAPAVAEENNSPIQTAQESLAVPLIETPQVVNQEVQEELIDTPVVLSSVPEVVEAPVLVNNQESPVEQSAIPPDLKDEDASAIEISLQQVFAGSPFIYTLLLSLSIAALCIWLYTILGFRKQNVMPTSVVNNLKNKLYSNQYDEALALCNQENSFFCKMLASGIVTRRHGLNMMVDFMKAEGKRASAGLWQRAALLNDIAIMAPMIGLLGTVLGMFYAFYDLNRSMESITTLFDGLGISVGTTVAGLIVAILAMVLQSLTKYRLVKLLADVENEIQSFAVVIDSHSSSLKGEKV